MRIGIVSNLYPPYARGGAEQIAWRTAHALYARGHKVFVLSTSPSREWFSPFHLDVEPQLEIVYRFYPPNFYHPLNNRSYPIPVRALWHLVDMYSPVPGRLFTRAAREERPDVILTHNLKGIGLQIVPAIRRLGLPHIHTIHDVQLSVPSGLLMYGQEHSYLNKSFLRRWYEGQMRRIAGSPDLVVSPSRFLADFYRARGMFEKSRVEIVPNPAPEARVPERGARPPGPVRLLFAGQLEEHKGIRFLLKALDTLDIPFVLHVAGDGSLLKEVAAWAENDKRVIFHGFESLDNLMKLFAICDATVVPSLCYENSPTVIYESLQSGVPVIASNIGGVGELVRDGENGYLVTPGKRDELLDAVRKLAANADSFHTGSAQLRAEMEPYQLGHYIDRLEELMKEVIAKKNRA